MNLRRKDGEIIKAEFKELDLSYIGEIMELQQLILEGLEDKQLYSPTEKEDFIEYINETGKIIGCIIENNELVAMGVYVANGYNEHNYGYDIGLDGEELPKVGQIESTVVRNEYRGNRLQRIICEKLEEIALQNNTPIVCATASPYNEFSLNNFKSLGYKVMRDKIKYGGLRRYVLMKNLED